MFSYLVEQVFYPISEFFGTLGGIATIRTDLIIDCLERALDGNAVSIFVDVFNTWEGVDPANVELLSRGFMINFEIFESGVFKFFGIFLYNFLNVFFGSFSHFPLFASIPLSFAKWGLIIGFIKFVFGNVKRVFGLFS